MARPLSTTKASVLMVSEFSATFVANITLRAVPRSLAYPFDASGDVCSALSTSELLPVRANGFPTAASTRARMISMAFWMLGRLAKNTMTSPWSLRATGSAQMAATRSTQAASTLSRFGSRGA